MHALWIAVFAGLTGTTPPPAVISVPPAGKAVYDTNCKKCHGVRGIPAPSMKKMMPKIPNLDAATLAPLTLADVKQAINKGKGDMKPYAAKLTAEEVNVVAAYVFELAKIKPNSDK